MVLEQGQGFVMGQAQVLLIEFEQLPRQAQARQMPIRPLAAGDKDQQPVGQVIEEKNCRQRSSTGLWARW
nr:hypothetical protein GCM10020185_19180 [Pseudomonas brassicacearum subsp. brassicacearum]